MPPCSRSAAARPRGPPDHCADAGRELVEVEGLAEVVVGAAVEPGDPVSHRVARREQDDGRPVLPAAQATQHVETGAVGEHQVEDDGRERARGDGRLGVGAGRDAVNGRPAEAEPRPEPVREDGIVLDDEDAHACLP